MNSDLSELRFFDYDGLKILLRETPDPVIARLLNIVDSRVRTSIFGAIDHSRMDSVRSLMQRESKADPEKDEIVHRAIASIVGKLIATGSLRHVDSYYFGKP